LNIYFLNLGCDKNLTDGEAMLGILKRSGHEIVSSPEAADAIAVNTCGFIKDAVKEGIENLLSLAEYKRSGNCRVLVAAGCMAERYREEILKEIPEVDAVIGARGFGRIAEAVCGGLASYFTDAAPDSSLHIGRMLTAPTHTASLKIADGCDNLCAYCTIPKIRGAYYSRPIEDIVAEAGRLAAHGVKELALVAQDAANYGADLYGSRRLPELLRELNGINEIIWIRLMYMHPEHITDEIIFAARSCVKVCAYMDVPMQHGSTEVLRRMGRANCTEESLRELVKKLRREIPGVALRTTMMAGFPGETEREFEDLLEFCADMRFERMGVFAYSKEGGTPAAKMKPQIAQSVKRERYKKLMRMQQKISAEILSSSVGKTETVMVDGRDAATGTYAARRGKDAFEIDGSVHFDSDREILSGELVKVTITGSNEYDLIGEEIN